MSTHVALNFDLLVAGATTKTRPEERNGWIHGLH